MLNSTNNLNVYPNFNSFNNYDNKPTQNTNAGLIAQTKPDTFEKSIPAAAPIPGATPAPAVSPEVISRASDVSAENSSKKQVNPDKTKPIIGGIFAAAGVILGGIFLHKKLNADKLKEQVQKILPEHIDFTAAATKDEAVKFGNQILGIKNYIGFEDGDVKVLNWINEGLVNINNKTKGKAQMPPSIFYDANTFTETIGENALAAAVPVSDSDKYADTIGNSILAINKKWFGNPAESIKEVIDANIKTNVMKKTESGYELAEIFMKNDTLTGLLDKFENGALDFDGQILLFDTLRKYRMVLTSLVKSPLNTYKQIASGKEGIKTMEAMPHDKQKATILKILNSPKFNVKIDVHNLKTPFETIYHEMGHIQDKVERVAAKGKFNSPSEYPAALKEWLDNCSNMEIANSVSVYAASGPGEFIAETFAKVMNGAKISDAAKQLYLKLNGPDMIF